MSSQFYFQIRNFCILCRVPSLNNCKTTKYETESCVMEQDSDLMKLYRVRTVRVYLRKSESGGSLLCYPRKTSQTQDHIDLLLKAEVSL